MTTKRTDDYLETLQGYPRFRVIIWNSLFPKRFHTFETLWNRGMATKYAYDKVCKMTSKEVKQFYKENYEK